MITIKNYQKEAPKLDWSKYPKTVNDTRNDIEDIMEFYNDDKDIKEAVDLFLQQLNIKSHSKAPKKSNKRVSKSTSFKNGKIPTNLSQFKKWLKENLGETIFLHSEYKSKKAVEILREGRLIDAVLTTQVKFLKDNGEESWLDFGKASEWKFFNTYAQWKSDQTTLTYYYKKPESFKIGKEVISTARKSTRTLVSNLPNAKKFIPKLQLDFLYQLNSEEYDGILERLEKELKSIPRKEQGDNLMESKVHAHYFIGGSDWFILDYAEDRKAFFGYAILNGDTQNSEAGYISIDALTKSKYNIELDFHWNKVSLEQALNDKYPGEFTASGKKTKSKQSQITNQKPKKISKTIDVKMVDSYDTEFKLLRRFYNLITKNINDKNIARLTFRQIQLIYGAFQKAIISREVRKTSNNAELLTKVNNKVVKIYNAAKVDQLSANVEIKDVNTLENIKEIIDGNKINYAVTLLRSVVSVQGTKPEITKVGRLIKRIENGFKNGKVDQSNRLYDSLKEALKELKDYIENPTEKIEPESYGLSAPLRSACTNRIKCSGIGKDGKLFKGYKFVKGGSIVKVKKKKTQSKPKISSKEKGLNAAILDPDQVIEITPIEVVLDVSAKPSKEQSLNVDEIEVKEAKIISPINSSVALKTIQNQSIPIVEDQSNENIVDGLDNPYKSVHEKLREEKAPVQLLNINDLDWAKFLGEIEVKPKGSLIITLDSPPGGGKTHTAYQFARTMARSGHSVIFWTLEEHFESKLSIDKQQKYFNEEEQKKIVLISDDSLKTDLENYNEIQKSIEYFDVILIDSWAKVLELNNKASLDKDFRKSHNGKIFLVINQRTKDGSMRGGANVAFDGDIILKVEKDSDDFRNNFVFNEKNRYNAHVPISELKYSPYYQKLLNSSNEVIL